MSEGVIIGGWNYVLAAYAVFAGVLVLHGASLFVRYRRSRQKLAREGAGH